MVFGSVGAPAAPEALVYLVDEDDGELKALARLLRAHGLAVRALPSATAFLRAHDPAVAGCAVLDVHLPGMDGLALQQALRLDGAGRPVVFITGSGEVEQGVRAMKAGAVDFLTKPVDEAALLGAVLRARGTAAYPRLPGVAHAARTRGAAPRGGGPPEQADRGRPRHRRTDHQGAPRARHGKDGCGLACPAGAQDARGAGWRGVRG